MSRASFSSRIKFILVCVGSAVGLGSIWKFPYEVGQNGGSAFILIYLSLVLLIGIPLLIVEIAIGRASQTNVLGAFRLLSSNPKSPWRWVGGLAILTSFFIFSYYTIVCGWSTGYIFEAAFSFREAETPAAAMNNFIALSSNPYWSLFFQTIFIALTAFIVARELKNGIERWCGILMPLLGILLLGMTLWGLSLPGASQALAYLFNPDFSKITTAIFIDALGLACFNLSIGFGIMITFGSYLKKEENILSSAIYIAFFDTLVSLLAAIVIFSPVFMTGQEPQGGPALAFKILPIVFQKMPYGYFFGILFFFLLMIAALAAAISLLEVPVAYLVEEKKWARSKAAWSTAGLCFFLLGIPCSLSFGILSEVKYFWGLNFFEFIEFISENVFLPSVALLTVVFTSFIWGFRTSYDEALKGVAAKVVLSFGLWKFLIGVVCPLLIILIMLSKLGLI